MSNIVCRLKDDIIEWISQNKNLITDERDLQVKLAIFLKNKKEDNDKKRYDNVFTEYRIPFSLLEKRLADRMGWERTKNPQNPIFPWYNNISVDIVVESKGEYACLELKYATRAIIYEDKRFGESLSDIAENKIDLEKVNIIKDQGAVDIVMYNYWKDVRRIEVLQTSFNNVKGGVALIVTNNHLFWDKIIGNPAYSKFSTVKGKGVDEILNWDMSFALKDKFPGFCLRGPYTCEWKETNIPYLTKVKDKISKKPYTFQFMMNVIQ